MGYPVRMSGEIRDWLRELRDRDPREARIVGEALAALAGEGPGLGPPFVVTPQAHRPRMSLDDAYQDMLERLTGMRRRVADAATQAKRMELRVAGLEDQRDELAGQRREAGGAGDEQRVADLAGELAGIEDELARLRPRLQEAKQAEQTLTARSQRFQTRVEAFRARKEALKAHHAAALAKQAVLEAMAAFGPDGDSDEAPHDREAEADAAAEVAQAEEEIAAALGVVTAAPEPGLLEVRTGAPGPSPIRILFALEPPGEILVLAVLDGSEAARERQGEAVAAASDLLRLVRAGQAPEAADHVFAGAGPLLEEILPGEADGAAAGAAALAARLRGRTLARQRERLGLTRAQVAARMGVEEEVVSAIERGGPGTATIGALARYVEALGGALEITADVAGERVLLR